MKSERLVLGKHDGLLKLLFKLPSSDGYVACHVIRLKRELFKKLSHFLLGTMVLCEKQNWRLV